MKIDTTINIDRAILEILDEAADNAGVSRSYLVSCLMHHIGSKQGRGVRTWERVRYQQRRERSRWKRVHVGLRGDEYEYFLDLKKVFKLSVSLIIATAIEHYIVDILNLIKNGTDNYHFHNYIFAQYMIDNIPIWAFYWGIPRMMLQIPT